METTTTNKGWERTNVTNLVRNGASGIYYARVKVNGKDKWKSLKTQTASVAKLRLADFEKKVRAQGVVAKSETSSTSADGNNVSRFISIFRQRIENDASLATATKTRQETAVKALVKTWPELPSRDARRVNARDCQEWATTAFRVGTGFISPKAKTKRAGMAPSSFNKCVDVLRGIFAIACEHGVAYENPAAGLTKAPPRVKQFDLPTPAQFQALVHAVADAGARQSQDCADMVQTLAYSGMRLAEGWAFTWQDINHTASSVRVHGTKTETSARHIPLFPALAKHLAALRARRPDDTEKSPVLRVHECKGALASACKAVGIKRLTHHDLRHLFATRCIEAGVDIPTVSRWLGHADGGALAMKTYGHLRMEHSQAQALRVTF